MFKINLNNEETLPILEKEKKNYGTSPVISSNDVLPSVSDTSNDQLNYPIAVHFVLCSKFFESYAANGVRTILALYLRDSLHFTEDLATTILHIFNFFSQFCPLFGAVLADSYLGNAKTISYFFVLYAVGFTGIILVTFPLQDTPINALVFISLLLISIGNGSIRACITSLGGEQFKLPEQQKSLCRYFSHYYFVYTMGICLSKLTTPLIRRLTHCYDQDVCYSAVFGSLAGLFIASWVVFLIGMIFYKKEELTKKNISYQVLQCTWYAMYKKFRGRSCHLNSWIDGAIGRYSENFVQDVSAFLKVLKLFLPLPIYWALLAQQDSSWTFQATKLNTHIFGYRIEPDQIKAIGPILLLILIPTWQNFILPMLNKINIHITPLSSLVLGGLAAFLAFLCAGILQIRIEKPSSEIPSVLWQIPQFLLLMMGEVLLAIPGLQFSFTQAPASMKSVLTAVWFVNNSIGNLIVVLITEFKPTKLQSSEYFLYAILMFIGIIIFAIIAIDYEYVNIKNTDSISKDEKIDKYLYIPEDTKITQENIKCCTNTINSV